MKNLFLAILIAFAATSCSVSRHVSNHKIQTDSTVQMKSDSTSVSNYAAIFETKNSKLTQELIKTKADSAKTYFSFNPDDTGTVVVNVESGGIQAEASFNKRTGKGLLSAYKKPETIPVNSYQEQSTKTSILASDSSVKSSSENTAVKKKEQEKTVLKKTNWTGAIVAGSLVLLLLLVACYFWLRNQYINPKRILP